MDKKELRAGAGAAVICFPKDFFAAFPGGTVSWNEPRVRALILDNGQRVCLVSLELASIAGDHIPGLQALVEEATGIPADHIWIMAARTPSAPELPPVAEMEALPASQPALCPPQLEGEHPAGGGPGRETGQRLCLPRRSLHGRRRTRRRGSCRPGSCAYGAAGPFPVGYLDPGAGRGLHYLRPPPRRWWSR